MKLINIISTSLHTVSSALHKKDFNQFFQEYLDGYSKKDKRVIKQAYTKYMEFIGSLPDNRKPTVPTSSTVKAFVDFLSATCKGCGASSTYSRFKKVVAQAVSEGILKNNPCVEAKCHCIGTERVKDILSEHEIHLMLKTCIGSGNTEIRKAFIFSLYTGLRFGDIINVRYSNIDRSNKLLSIIQSKTQEYVYIPLRDDILKLTVSNLNYNDPDQKVFRLPTHPTCMKELHKWTEEIGISKHITWHCARHTFASNILMNGADVRIVASLLGHSSLRYVERYTRAVDHKKFQAINTLPELN